MRKYHNGKKVFRRISLSRAIRKLIEKGNAIYKKSRSDAKKMKPLPGLKPGVSGLLHRWHRPMALPYDARMASASLWAAIHPQAEKPWSFLAVLIRDCSF